MSEPKATPKKRRTNGLAVLGFVAVIFVFAFSVTLNAVNSHHGLPLSERHDDCAGASAIRVAVGPDVYVIPAELQPTLEGGDTYQWGDKVWHHGSRTVDGRVVAPNFVYCQDAKDAPWVTSGFSLDWWTLAGAATANTRWAALSKVHFIIVKPPIKSPRHVDNSKSSRVGQFVTEQYKRGTDFVSIRPLIWGRTVFISSVKPSSSLPSRAYAFSTTHSSLSFNIEFDPANPDASLDAIRAVGDFVNSLKKSD